MAFHLAQQVMDDTIEKECNVAAMTRKGSKSNKNEGEVNKINSKCTL